MTSVRTTSVAAIPFRRSTARPWRANRPLLVAVALFLAVLIADVAMIAAAAPHIAELGSLYLTSI